VYKIMVVRPKGRRSLGRRVSTWEDNIKMGLMEVVWKDVDWIHLAQNRGR
jgi:hypothetical protein